MARSQETFSKKEREKKKRKKKKEKAERREQRKTDIRDGNKLDDMIMYVDKFGNFTEEPVDPRKQSNVKKEDIVIGVPPKEDIEEETVRKGIVKFFNEEKGYGFIIDQNSKENIFVHANNLVDEIRDQDKVTFEVEMGAKGPNAVDVKRVG